MKIVSTSYYKLIILAFSWIYIMEFTMSTHITVNEDVCGSADSNRIVGGVRASLGQYPWLARLGYNRTYKITFECAGALITKRHILTASHCVDVAPVSVVQVILGEHDARSETDCEMDMCADPVQIFEPILITYPIEYNNPEYKHDIALIKLNREVKYTRWIHPICLPLPNDTNIFGGINNITEVAGWGLMNSHDPEGAKVLQTVKLKIVSMDECREAFESLELGPEQMCAGGIPGKDSCSGDSGGPMQKGLAFRNKGPRYFAIGIVSLGMKMCGGEFATAALYTNVSFYIPWILNNLD
uniref:CSON003142 protein n=1 Tax=Culicoides sonorensis TaxID=179676 RepID=A0A336MQD4_CULSO